MMKPHLLIQALLRQPVDRFPVWFMRQAGRYLPEYRKLREEVGGFTQMIKSPDVACEITLQPLRRFPLDAAIIFSDILTIPDAMGLGLSLVEKVGPVFERPVRTKAEIAALPIPDPGRELAYVCDAIQRTRKALNDDVALIGFSGSPWTLATYMIEGGSSKQFALCKALAYQDPETMHLLLQKLADACVLYLNAQIDAGADAVMLFDTWGGILSPQQFNEFSVRYLKEIVSRLKKSKNNTPVPCVVFSKSVGTNLPLLLQTDANALGVDWTMDLADAKRLVNNNVALQGNLDPLALFGSQESLETEVSRIVTEMKDYPGFVFNLGHGILPQTPIENVAYVVERVRALSL